MRIRILAIGALASVFLTATSGQAASSLAPQGLSLRASPTLVDVGQPVAFTLMARKWNGPVAVSVSFVSPHHGFTGSVPYKPSCNCFQIGVVLARRIHPLETAKAVAHVKAGKSTFTASTGFMIRGLAANGHDFSPGGRVFLTAWVSDAHPSPNETEHFCGWTKTLDGFSLSGYRMKFVVHLPGGARTLFAGPTTQSGVACGFRSIGSLNSGTHVRVDAYSSNLHAVTSFTSQG